MVTKSTMDKWIFFYTVFLPTLISITENRESRVRVVLMADPAWSNVVAGETVNFTCRVNDSEPFMQWEYSWKKRRGAEETTLSSDTEGGLSVYTVSHVTESDSAQYLCEARAGETSAVSVTHTLNVLQLVTLTVQPDRRTFKNTEQVTLSCKIHSNLSDWGYLWYKDEQELPIDTAVDTYTIHSAVPSDSGKYSCRGNKKGEPIYSDGSNTVNINISGLLVGRQAVLTLETPWAAMFGTGNLTLRCVVRGSPAEWNYTWYRNGLSLPPGPGRDTLALTPGNHSYHSEYMCRGESTDDMTYTEFSKGCVPAHKISRALENLARCALGAAILLFLAIIVNEGFWRRVRKMRGATSEE
ncbi:basement membrane-specific heparan sulfate proteoglycan core protein-like isoform X1 [Conger conger]|nr:basement membrane-specific heparan sulfate proteoglycan core protein-like isoform X1 [Conger conger]